MRKGKIPELTLGDRLMLAREHAGIGSSEMAEKLKCSRHSITNAERGRTRPSYAVVREWSRITGYDLEWLLEGKIDEPSVRATDEELAAALVKLLRGRDSNSQPTGLHPIGCTCPKCLLEPEEMILDLRDEPASIIGYRQSALAS